MDHTCHRCGAAVEDGVPFCAHCGAPQIRVTVEASEDTDTDRSVKDDAATPPLPPGTPGDLQPPAEPLLKPQRSATGYSPLLPGFPPSIAPAGLVWATAIRVSLVVGIVAGFVTIVPSLAFLTLLMVAAGAVSVRIYRGRIRRSVSGAEGFRLGALTGIFCSLIKIIISVLQVLIPEGRAEMMKQMDAQIAAAMARNADPAAQEMVNRMADYFRTPEGFATMFMVGLLIVLLFSVLLAGVGGSLGASLFGRKEPSS